MRLRLPGLAAALVLGGLLAAQGAQQPPRAGADAPARTPDVVYLPTSEAVVEAMLDLAQVTSDDVVYDLGSGDGRIPIAAARKYGARAVGIEIDPVLIRQAKANLDKAGLNHLVTFRTGDLFETSISEATVVTLFLLPRLNLRLMPKLKGELGLGSRIVSHQFDMGPTWPPQKTQMVPGGVIYLWTIE